MSEFGEHTLSTSAPDGWKVVPLGDALEKVVGGGTPARENPAYWEGSIPWFTVKDMRTRRPADSMDHISEVAVRNSSTNVIPADTVIIATRIGLGKVIRVPFPAAINQDLKALIPKNGVDKNYLEYWIYSIANYLESIGSGTTVKGIRLEQLKSLPFPIAPLEQQRCIVAEIEKQFSRLDEAVANLKRVKANLKRYKAAVLKAAVEGKLTEEWRKQNPNIEPASKLLERILAERRKKWEEAELAKMKAKGKEPKNDMWKGNYKAGAELDSNDLSSLPKGWVWVRLEQILGSLRNGISAKPDQDDGLAILRISAVRPLTVNLDDVRYLPAKNSMLYESYQLRDGDLLFTRYNGNPDFVGVCGAVKNINASVVHPDKIIRATVANEADTDPRFLEMALNSGESRVYLASMVRTTAGQSGVSGADIKNVPIPLPPSAEQKSIIQLIEKDLSIIASTELHLLSLLQRAEQLRQSILKKSFNGEVP